MFSSNSVLGFFVKIQELEELIPDNILTESNKLQFSQLTNKKIPNIALLGNSGDGKSSLLNTILNSNFLDTGGSGSAVTSCPCEIQYGEQIKFELVYEDLSTIIDSDLKSDIIIAPTTIPSDKMNSLWEQHYEMLGSKMNEHIEVCNNKFINNPIFMKKPKVLKVVRFCNKKIPLINDLHFKLSPLIKKIKLFIPNPLLKKITLVDLPGLGDSCGYRIQRTHDYLSNEADFIALVNKCSRITTAVFIDENLNSFILNSIIRSNIKDILVIGTYSDSIHTDIASKIKEDDIDDDDDYIGLTDNGMVDEDDDTILDKLFKLKLSNIKKELENKIDSNENLRVRRITRGDIHIMLTSTKLDQDISGFNELKNKINEIIDYKQNRVKDELKMLVKKIYTEYNDYIKRPRKELENNNKLLIDTKFKKLEYEIKTHYSLILEDVDDELEIFTLKNTKHIKTQLENIKKLLSEDLHGKTTTAVLQKLNHTSNQGMIFNVAEKIINVIHTTYLSYMKDNILDKIDNKISLKNQIGDFIIKSDINSTFKRVFGDNYNLEDFNRSNLELNEMLKNIYTEKHSSHKSLFDIISEKSLELITSDVINVLENYQTESKKIRGTGTCDKIRAMFVELYTDGISNICQGLNTSLQTNFNSLIIDEQKYYNDKMDDILLSLNRKYVKKNINYELINTKFNYIDSLYNKLDIK